jgi:hypothetical protein
MTLLITHWYYSEFIAFDLSKGEQVNVSAHLTFPISDWIQLSSDILLLNIKSEDDKRPSFVTVDLNNFHVSPIIPTNIGLGALHESVVVSDTLWLCGCLHW